MHLDKHVIKMVLETCQLLSTAHHLLGDTTEPILYKKSHVSHPSAKWTRESRDNYLWLAELLECLCAEYTFRYGKTHKSQRIGLVKFLQTPPANIPIGQFTEPTPAMPDKYKVAGDSIKSYRNYYNNDKAYIGKWKNRPTPVWFQPVQMPTSVIS